MYNYYQLKQDIFTEKGQARFLIIRDNVNSLLAKSGAVMMENAISELSGDSWERMSYVDRMVELGELIEVSKANTMGQHRVFMRGNK